MTNLFGLQSKYTPIGVDIGACGARVAQLVQAGAGYVVTQADLSNWPGDVAVTEGEPPLAAGAQVVQAMLGSEFRGRRAVAALSPPDAEFHALDLPAAVLEQANTEAGKAARFEIGRLLSEPVEELETRFWPLPATRSAAAGMPNAVGVAARREKVLARVKLCETAGLRCRRVDTSATALARLGAFLVTPAADAVWGLLDCGGAQTRLVLCTGQTPVLVRRVASGGRHWTQRIAESLQVTPAAAEVQKQGHGIALDRAAVGSPRPGAPDTATREVAHILWSVLRSELKEMAAEIKRSYEYVLSCYPQRSVGDLLLVGGGARLRNLPEYLADALGIPVRRASSCLKSDGCRIVYVSGKQNPFETVALAIGLALAESAR